MTETQHNRTTNETRPLRLAGTTHPATAQRRGEQAKARTRRNRATRRGPVAKTAPMPRPARHTSRKPARLTFSEHAARALRGIALAIVTALIAVRDAVRPGSPDDRKSRNAKRATPRKPTRRGAPHKGAQTTPALRPLVVAAGTTAVVAVVATATTMPASPAAPKHAPAGMSATLGNMSGNDNASVMVGTIDAEGFAEPNIWDDCEVIWSPQEDGTFTSTNGAVLGSQNLFGVDVSSHDGDIDWETAKAAGLDFAIIRCGFGADNEEWDDETWHRNASECERLGIPYGAYLYSYAQSAEGARTEAEHTIRLLEGHEPILGVWYDIEELAQAEAMGYDEEEFDRLVDLYAKDVESATGCEVGVYTSSSWLFGHMSKVREDAEHPIWCACWCDGAPTGIDYECWQAGAAEMPGFAHTVDFDVVLHEG